MSGHSRLKYRKEMGKIDTLFPLLYYDFLRDKEQQKSSVSTIKLFCTYNVMLIVVLETTDQRVIAEKGRLFN